MEEQAKPKCPECPEGLPAWMATFSDLVTLLLTFFVLLLSFAKTETSKYESALGSIRNAFGGNTKKFGEVLMPGKSPDDAPTMIDSQEDVKPFPIDFLTTEGFLDKHEINRESDEELVTMRNMLKTYQLADFVDVYEVNEGIKVFVKDKIYFEEGSTEIAKMNVESFSKMISLLKNENWTVYVQGFSASGENKSGSDAFAISAKRATAVSRLLIEKGIKANQIATVFYGDSRPQKLSSGREGTRLDQRRVEFIIRKRDISARGHKVSPR